MSSLKLSDAPEDRRAVQGTGWIVVDAPQPTEACDSRPSGVVLSLRARRKGLQSGTRRSETVFLDLDADGGDDQLARDIEADLDNRWDS